MNNQTLTLVSWPTVADFIAAGNITQIEFEDNLATVNLEISYLNIKEQQAVEAYFKIICTNCAYIVFRRLYHHSEGSGTIYEAYLNDQSALIDSFYSNSLEGKAGTLSLQCQGNSSSVKHLEIIGEVSLEIICEGVSIFEITEI